jgi:hypothetical protein
MHENEISERIIGAAIEVHVNFHELVLKDGISRVVNGLKLPPPEPGSFKI